MVAIKNELSQQPDDPLISFRIGRLCWSISGLWDYAELAFQHASDVSYPNPQALAYLGWVKSSQGKDGSSWIHQATQLAPQDAEVWYLRSLHFRAQADYVESLDAIAQSVRLAPENSGLVCRTRHSIPAGWRFGTSRILARLCGINLSEYTRISADFRKFLYRDSLCFAIECNRMRLPNSASYIG